MPNSYPPPSNFSLAMMRGALEELPIGVATWIGDAVEHANAALERIYGAEKLDGVPLSVLFDASTRADIETALEKKRVFDGRIRTRGRDGREIHAELHLETYRSEAGSGGFLLLRDVSFEMHALRWLVDLMGGALFRVRVDNLRVEMASPRIAELIDIDPRTLISDPSCLKGLISPDDQRRLAGLYQQIARNEIVTVTTQVVVRLSGGRSSKLTLRATGRPDSSGVVRHVDGVVMRESRAETEESEDVELGFSGLTAARSLLDVSGSLLKEAAQLNTTVTSVMRDLRSLSQTVEMPDRAKSELSDKLQAAAEMLGASTSLTRRVRRAMAGTITTAMVRDVLENVQVSVGCLQPEGSFRIDVGSAGLSELTSRIDEITLALIQLTLRCISLLPKGIITVKARSDGRDILIDISGRHGDSDSGAESLAIPTPRRTEIDKRLVAARNLLAETGGTIETDSVQDDAIQCVVRLATGFASPE